MKSPSIKPWLIAQLAVLTLLAVYGVSAGADSVGSCDTVKAAAQVACDL